MKRIEFIAPVESMRGNLSGSQKLNYPTDNNAAYDSPVGSRNYATNYQPRFIGAKRASDNLKYFAVRTKSAIGLTARSKHVMALLGGAGAMIGSILNTPLQKSACEAAYDLAKKSGATSAKSLRQFLTEKLQEGLEAKAAIISIRGTYGEETATFFARNPWVYTTQSGGQEVKVSNTVLVKFWTELATSPVIFLIGGMKGVAHGAYNGNTADSFAQVIASKYNVLGLSLGEMQEGGFKFVKYGDNFVVFDDNGETYGAADNRVVSKQAGDESNTLAFYLSDESYPIWTD